MYKVGDTITIRSLKWYLENKNEEGDIVFGKSCWFIPKMAKYCGKNLTIVKVSDNEGDGNFYEVFENGYNWKEETIVPRHEKLEKILGEKENENI